MFSKHWVFSKTHGYSSQTSPMDSAIAKHCPELVAGERSGHTAVVEGNFLYVWGGYVSIAAAEVFLPNDEVWFYDLERGVWEMGKMSGEVPPPMSGTCGCSLNGDMYIFGGCNDNGQTNQLYCVNLLDGKYSWRKVNHKSGSTPSPRDKLSCWVFNGRLIYFAGYGHKQLDDIRNNRSFLMDEASTLRVDDIYWGWNNEVHMFDPTSASWSEPHTSGRAPDPRAAHASATLGHKGYVCGGRIRESRTSDIHCLDLESWTWSEIVPASTVPMGRSWHTLTAVYDSALFLFGGLGIDCEPMSDGWAFDVETKKWRALEHPYMNKPRLWHTACQGKDSDVIVFGGSCDYILLVDTGHCNDALVFQIQPYPLFRICEDYIAKNVKNCKLLQKQLPCMPPKLLSAVQRRMSFF
ncbi:kelch domain-containing protein 1 isoform X2 [Coregonus clupeaformis]|uniref:kelch domain-containing protein 1 isoform X2 n=1 Tax=Coregonus clupeaformis TaxID=59861 RepID=UPI001BE10E53|nr:kelch domain-containing protein 1 isoform X2 [Coregonus clupeaformis]